MSAGSAIWSLGFSPNGEILAAGVKTILGPKKKRPGQFGCGREF
jgi:hypothetical protein